MIAKGIRPRRTSVKMSKAAKASQRGQAPVQCDSMNSHGCEVLQSIEIIKIEAMVNTVDRPSIIFEAVL